MVAVVGVLYAAAGGGVSVCGSLDPFPFSYQRLV